MRKIYIIPIIVIILFLGIVGVILLSNKDVKIDDNSLYSITFDDVKIRIMKYDDVLGQNQTVGVEVSHDNETYELITKELVTVSDEAMFNFLNKDVGFIISKPNLSKNNNIYYGVYVTSDGGKTFNHSKIYYDNPNIQIITILDTPYYEDGLLKLPCSIYQIKEDDSGYEDVNIIFTSYDNGLSFHLDKDIDFKDNIKLDTEFTI